MIGFVQLILQMVMLLKQLIIGLILRCYLGLLLKPRMKNLIHTNKLTGRCALNMGVIHNNLDMKIKKD